MRIQRRPDKDVLAALGLAADLETGALGETQSQAQQCRSCGRRRPDRCCAVPHVHASVELLQSRELNQYVSHIYIYILGCVGVCKCVYAGERVCVNVCVCMLLWLLRIAN